MPTAIRIVFPHSTVPASRAKGLNSVVRCLSYLGFIVEVSSVRPNVFILTPESALRIETLLFPPYPHRVRGMTVTYRRCALPTEDEECDEQCSICFRCLDDEERTETSCDHEFHTRCLGNWETACLSQGRQLSCPLCRAT